MIEKTSENDTDSGNVIPVTLDANFSLKEPYGRLTAFNMIRH